MKMLLLTLMLGTVVWRLKWYLFVILQNQVCIWKSGNR